MEKRVALAFFVSFLILLGFRVLYPPPDPVESPAPSAPVQSDQSDQKTPDPKTALPVAAEMPKVPDVERQALGVEELELATPLYQAVFSNAGAVLKRFVLLGYKDAAGQPIDLLSDRGLEASGHPLTLATGNPEQDAVINKGLYVSRRMPSSLEFEFAADGLRVLKTVRSDAETHRLEFTVTATKDGQPLPVSVLWQGGFGDQSIAVNASHSNVVYRAAGAFKRLNVASASDTQALPAASTYVGVEDQYFLAMLLLPREEKTITVTKREVPGANGKTVQALGVSAPVSGTSIGLYIGPKQQADLKAADPALDAVIDYGFFSFITRPLLFALLWLNQFLGNYGWSIIVLTVFINLVLFPLRLKQQASMQKMQKLQPQMRTLQDKYKKLKANDPRRQETQNEMMALYRQHGINPMGGCLPLLLQMPFLIGFWTMLSVAIELRQAPWMLWIRDLSQHDPYFVAPILMAVSMFVQQKMTPSTMDPAQAKIMMLMPLMLTVMFLWVQSGVMLYWLTSNVAGIGQQVFINKYWSPQVNERIEKHRGKSRGESGRAG